MQKIKKMKEMTYKERVAVLDIYENLSPNALKAQLVQEPQSELDDATNLPALMIDQKGFSVREIRDATRKYCK